MWYEKDYRRIFMDMHLNDTNEEYLSKLDVDRFVACLKEAGATSVVVKAKSHVGLHYWPGKYGKMHATLQARNLDYVGEMTKKCHENGIHVIVYFSQIYDNYAYEHHKNWRLRSVVGTPSRLSLPGKVNRYGLVCPNHPKYRKYCTDILTELAEKYPFDGMFLDMPFWPYPCYCKHCTERFFKETGKMIPRIYHFDKPIWREYIHARQRWLQEFMEENTAAIKQVNPNISVEHNMAGIGLGWINGNTEANFTCSDYAGGDYYGGYAEQSFMCKYYNNVTENKPFCYITSRCDRSLYFHTVSRTMEDLLIHAVTALTHNGAFSICDAMNPDGTITEEMYSGAIREVFSITAPLEKYVSGELQSDVAVWYNTNYKVNKNFVQSPMRIAEILREKNIAFDVVGSQNLRDLQARVLCIADAQEITDAEVEDISAYLDRGGKVFVTGALGNNPEFARLAGIDPESTSRYTYCYINPSKDFADCMKTFNAQSPYPIEHSAIQAKVTDSAVQVLATLTYPYTLRSDSDFAAIHSDPPGVSTDWPAVTGVQRSKGYLLWVAAPLELTPAYHCRQSVADIILFLLGDKQPRVFSSDAPDFVEIVRWNKDGEAYLAIINQQEKTPVFPLDHIHITLNGVYTDALELSNTDVQVGVCPKTQTTDLQIDRLGVFCMLKLICDSEKQDS